MGTFEPCRSQMVADECRPLRSFILSAFGLHLCSTHAELMRLCNSTLLSVQRDKLPSNVLPSPVLPPVTPGVSEAPDVCTCVNQQLHALYAVKCITARRDADGEVSAMPPSGPSHSATNTPALSPIQSPAKPCALKFARLAASAAAAHLLGISLLFLAPLKHFTHISSL